MSGSSRGRVFPTLATTLICVDKDAAKIERLNRGRSADLRAGARGADREEHRLPGGFRFTTDLAQGGRWRRGGFHCGRHADPPGRRARGPDLCDGRSRRDWPGVDRLCGGGDEVDGSGWHQPQAWAKRLKAANPQARVRCRLEPRVSARRSGDRRFHASRPGGGGGGIRHGEEGHGRALPAAFACANFRWSTPTSKAPR